jgi:cytoskeletal protein CcmA (bactofilin family)
MSGGPPPLAARPQAAPPTPTDATRDSRWSTPPSMQDRAGHVNGRKTLVDEGTRFKGSLSSECPIEVRGQIDGDLAAPMVVVTATGAVRGTVKVAELHSQGELAGAFDTEVAKVSGTVKENTVIRAKSLEVNLVSRDGKLKVVFGES